ncbi:MAG TPA: arsinothricin resistance N-acetyltransferase ArsN1 family B [Rubricoccaceae bacterium]|nr:arsinothricin resistance N-acetyltransferase ArsN1 family B [Rubricoccaceae bacterium]
MPTLRLATPADAAGCLALYAPVVRDTAISFEGEPPTESEFANRIAATLEKRPWLVCTHGEEVLGYAYAAGHRERAAYGWCVEVSVYVAPEAQRRGVARALYTALFAVLRAQGYANAYAGIALPNEASLTLHRALGFEEVGVYRRAGYKLGRWHDVWWGALDLLPDRTGEPAPPRLLPALVGDGTLDAALAAGAALLR